MTPSPLVTGNPVGESRTELKEWRSQVSSQVGIMPSFLEKPCPRALLGKGM